MPSDRLLEAPEAEAAVLGAALWDPTSADRVVQDLTADDFADPRHQAIYRAMCGLMADAVRPDYLTVQHRLEESGELDMVGGVAAIYGLDASLPDLSSVPNLIRTLQDRALRRASIDSARAFAQACREDGGPADAHLSRHRKALDDAEQRHGRVGRVREACEVGAEVLAELRKPRAQSFGIMSGLRHLDVLTHGLLPGRLYILAGRPGTGKTAMAQQYMVEAAKAGRSVVLVSLEMGAREILRRMASSVSGIDHSHVQPGRIAAGELERLEDALAEMDGWKTWISDEAIETPQRVLAYARRHKRERGLDLLIVDYLQLMAPDGKFESRNLEVAAATRAMKLGARELNCPILLLSQLNRAVERRMGGKGRPTLADLRDSGAVEQDSDVVMFLWNPDTDDEARESWQQTKGRRVEIDVAKNRHGPMGSVTTQFHGWTLRFVEVVDMYGNGDETK